MLGTRTQAASTIDLAVVGTASPDPVAAGAPFTYDLTVTNQKGSPAHNLTVTVPLAGATFVSTSNTNWTCTPNATDLVCVFSSAVPTPKISPLPLSMIAPTAPGTYPVTIQVTSDEIDSDPTNNSLSLTLNVGNPSYDLGVALTASAGSVAAGGTYAYTAVVSSTGPSAAAGVTYDQTLPAGATFNGTSSAGWSCAASGSPVVVSCTLGTVLASGGSSTLVLQVTAPSSTGSASSTGTVGPTTNDPNLTNNSATATINVLPAADLAVTLSGPASVTAGAAYAYDAVVSNSGPNDSGAVTYQQTLPAGVGFVDAAGSDAGWSCTGTGAPVVVSCTLSGALAASLSSHLVLNVTAPADGGALSTTGTVSQTGASDPTLANNTASVSSTLVPLTGLSVALSGPASVAAGATSTYSVSVANAGPSNASGVTVTIPVPAGATQVGFGGSSPGWSCTQAAGTVTCSLSGALAVGAAPSLVADVTWASSATGSSTVSATVGPQINDPDLGDNTASLTVTFTASADLVLTASAAPAPATAGQPFTYAVSVANAGPSDATGVQVDVPLAGTTFNGAAGAGWTCTLNGAGTDVICSFAGTLVSGASAALSVTVGAPAEAGTVAVTLTTSGATPDPELSNNSLALSTDVQGAADLSVSLSASATEVPAEAAVTYDVAVGSAGPSTAQAVTVTVTLPDGFTGVSAGGAGWSCTVSGAIATCTQASFSVGSASLSVSAIAPAATGSQTVSASIGSTGTSDPDLANNSASITTDVIAPSADVSIALAAGGTSVDAGATATFTATLANAGPSLADAVQATFTLDPGASLANLTAPTGITCTPSGQQVVCAASGPLAPSDSAVIELEVTPPPDASTLTVSGVVSNGAVADPDSSNDSASATLGVTPRADLSVSVAPIGGVASGAAVTFAVTPGNAGPSTAQALTLIQTLPAGFTDVTPDNANGWSCSVAPDGSGNTVVSCARAAQAAGESATLSISASAPSALGPYSVTTAVSSATADPDLANNAATTAVNVTGASSDLTLSLTGPATASATESLAYVATASNQGPSPASNLTVTFTLPANASLGGSPSGTGWTCTPPAGGVKTCVQAATLLPGETAPALTLFLTPPPEGGTVTVSATVSCDSAEVNPADNTASVTTDVSRAADLSVPMVASATSVPASSPVTFTLTPTNAGPSEAGDGSAAGVTVTATLPAGFTLTSTSATGFGCIPTTGGAGETVVTCTAGTLPAGVGPSIVLATLSPATTGSFSVSAAIASTTADPVGGNDTSSLAITVSAASANLAIALSGPALANAGQPLVYAVGVSNAGLSNTDGVTVTLPIPSGMALSAGSGAGWSCAEASPGGVDSAVCTLAGTLENGQSAPALTVALTSPAEGGTASVSATVSGTAADPDLSDNTAGPVVTAVTPQADVSVSLAASPDQVPAGGTVSFSVGVSNAGPSTAQGLQVDLAVPANAVIQSASGSGWSCVASAGGESCTMTSLAPGSAQAIALQLTAPPDAGTLTVDAVVSGTIGDPVAANNQASSTVGVTASADLSVSAVASADPVVQSADLRYDVALANAGPSEATGLVFTQTLLPGATFTSATGAGWSCTTSGDPVTLTCHLASLAAGESAPLTVETVAPPDLGSGVSTLAVSGTEADPELSNNQAQVSTTVALPPPDVADLAVQLTPASAQVYAGTQTGLSLSVANDGPDAASAVSVTANLPNARSISAGGTGWSCGVSGTTVSCTASSLAAGAAAEVSLVVTLDQALEATASVTSETGDPQLANNSATASVAVQPRPDVVLTASSPSPVSAGAVFAYSVSVSNGGASAATGVTVTQVLPAGATYVDASGTGWSCQAGASTVTCALGWALAEGAQADLTVNVTAPTQAGEAVSTFTLATSTPNAAAAADTEVTVHTQIEATEQLTEIGYLATGGGCSGGGNAGPYGPLALLLLAAWLLRGVRKVRAQRLAAVGAVLLATTAGAQGTPATGLDIQRFRPGTGAYDVLNVESPRVLEGGWHFAAVLNVSDDPLELRLADTQELATRIVGWQYTADLMGSVGLGERFEVGLLLPVTLQQTSSVPSISGSDAFTPGGGGLGDLRLAPKVRLYGARRGFSLGLSVPIVFPTAGAKNFLGQVGVGVDPRVLAEWASSSGVRLNANVGVDLRRQVDFLNVRSGNAFTYGVGAELPLPKDLTAQLTLTGALGLVGGDNAMNRPVELLGALRWAASDAVSVVVGGGPGMSQAYGTPAFRMLLGVAWTQPPAPDDGDHDGIADASDACLTVPGVANADPKKNGCPRDTDDDRIADAQDACVSVPGVASADPKKNGCPKDTDGDRIADAQDACVGVPGVASVDPKKNGCPADTDNDRIADAQDACVTVPGVASADPKKNGCPPDGDADGIADARDACVSVPGVANPDPKKNGCPKDTDSDGIADARDACVKVPGVENKDPSLNGCPKDTDADGIADASDACLTSPGIANPDPKKNGCPVWHGPKVVIQGNKVVIFERVYFAFGKARILRRSYKILDDVAKTLAEHPELTRIRVEGHTDSRGRPAFNLTLSQQRAENVRRYLVGKGISEGRLEAVGYGDQRPVASNRTARGRERNRRVELTIVPPPQVVETERP